MIKKILLLLIFPAVVFAQGNNQGQSIELPDFVITGVQNIDIKTMKKRKPDFISTLSKEFLLPSKSPSEFSFKILSEIVPPDTNVNYIKWPYNAYLKAGVGINTIPVGEFNFTASSRHVMLNAGVWGLNEREYIDNAGYNVSGAKLTTDFFISGASAVFPGMKISLDGGFFRDKYKFYGSALPGAERETKNVYGGVGLIDKLGMYNFGLEIKGQIYNWVTPDLEEKLFSGNGFLEFNVSRFKIFAEVEYKKQLLNNNLSVEDSYDYYSAKAFTAISPVKNLLLKGGAGFAHYSGSEDLFSIYAGLNYKLNKSFSVIAEYSPGTEFLTLFDFVNLNRFYNLGLIENVFVQNKANISGTLKYEFEKYVEVTLSAGYKKTDNYLYFQDFISSGLFEVVLGQNIETTTASLAVKFHKGPMGQLYGELNYNQAKFANGNYVPYKPQLAFEADYIYCFPAGLDVNLKVKYYSEFYSDPANIIKMDPYINIMIGAKYSLARDLKLTLDLNNILNRKNYLLFNYQEIPFDVIAGVEYRW